MSTAAPLQTLAAKPRPLINSTHAGLLLQRKCACEAPTASLTGECAECTNKKFLQTKLAIGASNDPLEREADRVADQVLAAPANPAGSGAPPHIQRLTGQTTGKIDTAPASVDRVLSSSGRPLDSALRQNMEQRFSRDFSRVRVHSDAAAEQSARDVRAHAYTVGRDVVFGANLYAPGTHEGRRLIAHELVHVVQQSGADAPYAAHNRAISILQRTPGPGEPAPFDLKIREQIDAFRRGMTRVQELRKVSDRLIEQVLGSAPTRSLGARRNGLAEIARRGGPQADAARQLGRTLAEIETELSRRAAQVTSVADDLIESRLGARPKTPHARESALRAIQVNGGKPGEHAAGLGKELQQIEQELIERQPRPLQASRFAKVEETAAKSEKTVGGAAAKTEAKAVGAEGKVAGAEAKAIKAETAAADVVAGAAKATKAARIGRLLMALAMPGPLDVFILFLSAFASIAEAKAKLRADAYALGFAQGLAAVITWTQAADAERMLLYKVANPSIGERVAGFEGVREKGTNDGVMAGWKFANALNGDQRKGFRAEALAATGLRERRHSSRDDLIRMGAALKPTVVELLAEAERQERQKRLAEEWRLASLRPPV